MARRALLIGSQTGELKGVDNDIESMTRALAAWGFDSVRCTAATASRAGILDAYERLIADARPDDAIVVYYSGHGGYCPDRGTGSPPNAALQFIVPTDFDESAEGDFRGIMSVELSILQARLTEKTRNVTVALDCCHAAHMAREDNRRLVVKAHPRPVSYALLAGHLDSVRRRGRDFDLYRPPSNPWAVRIVACAPEQSAFECDNAHGVRSGLLTDALTQALAEAHAGGLRVSWSTIIDRVRQRVLTYMPLQRPEAEGPAHRLVFQTVESDETATLPVLVSGGRVSLEGASLLGARVGDEFTIMPADSCRVDDASKIGDIVVDQVHGTSASGELRPRGPAVTVPLGARAYQRRASAAAMPVRLPGAGPARAALAREVDRSPLLRTAGPGETCPVEVREEGDGQLTIWDQAGPLRLTTATGQPGLADIVRNLQLIARASALRCVVEDLAHTLDNPIDIEFGLVDAGEPRALSSSGAVLYLGQRIYVRVRNNGSQTVYVSLLDIGVSSQIALLNPASPGGEAVEPGTAYTFGWNDAKHTLQGSSLGWPQALRRDLPRPETVVVVVSSQPQNMRALEQHSMRGLDGSGGFVAGGRSLSPLERLFHQVGHGGARDATPEEGAPVRFTVRTVDFTLVPVPPPVGEDPEFQVDERPDPSFLLWSARGLASTTLAVRLSELTVHHNRAFRGTDIRLDTMVLTRGPERQPVAAVHTERFSDIRDGQLLPLENMLIYHGAVVDYLDIAVWVSRDASGSLALADLLQEKLTSSEVQLAMGQVSGLLMAAPQAAVALAAISAGAVLINTGYHLLTGIVGQSIGLYRTTLLAGERFGIGRPREQCTVRAQDFSLRYLVEEVT